MGIGARRRPAASTVQLQRLAHNEPGSIEVLARAIHLTGTGFRQEIARF